MAKRYDQLIEIVRQRQPRVIVEVGVHRGVRAAKMCAAVDGPVHYIGYDVFDTMGPQYQADALNGKGETSKEKAMRRLEALKAKKKDFTYEFRIGDTRETLHGQTVKCDLAFIDGDHRVDAIIGDFLAIDAPIVVLDDWYLPGPNGNIPDLDKFGANAIGALYEGKVKVLPMRDVCVHGGYSHLAVVQRD
jgi:hypothetical protein